MTKNYTSTVRLHCVKSLFPTLLRRVLFCRCFHTSSNINKPCMHCSIRRPHFLCLPSPRRSRLPQIPPPLFFVLPLHILLFLHFRKACGCLFFSLSTLLLFPSLFVSFCGLYCISEDGLPLMRRRSFLPLPILLLQRPAPPPRIPLPALFSLDQAIPLPFLNSMRRCSGWPPPMWTPHFLLTSVCLPPMVPFFGPPTPPVRLDHPHHHHFMPHPFLSHPLSVFLFHGCGAVIYFFLFVLPWCTCPLLHTLPLPNWWGCEMPCFHLTHGREWKANGESLGRRRRNTMWWKRSEEHHHRHHETNVCVRNALVRPTG